MKRTNFSFANFTLTLFALSFIAVLSVGAHAQHLISTKAGFVNRADGKVLILRHDSEDGEPGRASMGTQMREGDKLITTADSRAEILLNPGSYLRLNELSEARAVSTSLSEIRFEVVKGSAIVEVGQIEKKNPIEIATPNGVFSITKDSLVRIDAKTAATWVAVRQGEVYLGDRNVALANDGKAKLKRGKVARLTGSAQPEIAKVDQDAADNFDSWSFNRAQTLVAANYATLRNTGFGNLAYGWVYNPFYGCYTFIPGRGMFVSPYGFGFYRNFGDCYCYSPYGGYYGPYYGGGRNNNGGGMVSNLPPRVITGNDRQPIVREIPSNRTVDFGESGRSIGGRGLDDFGSSRGVSSPSSSPSVISAPAPVRSGGDSGGAMPSRGGGDSGGGRPAMPARTPNN